MPSFLSIGECMIELAPVGDGTYRRGFAGDTFNTAWYARRLLPPEWQVSYLTGVGTDAVSEEMTAFLRAEGIATDALRQVPDRTVGLYMISLNAGERSFSYWRGQSAAKALADDPDWLAATLENRDVIHFSGITLAILSADARDRLCTAIAAARAAGSHVAFDTNLRPRLWESEDAMRAGLLLGASVADTVLPSFDEECALFGDASVDETLERYRSVGARRIAVKDGGGPVTMWDAEAGVQRFQPPKVPQVTDSTAAGDSFAAGFLAHAVVQNDMDIACTKAMALAAQVIQHRGALVPAVFDALLTD